MPEPVRFARVAEAYSSTSASAYFRQRSASDCPSRDTVQISEEAQQKSKEFMMKLKAQSSSDQSCVRNQTRNNPEILQLSANATRDQIRSAYLGAVKQYHPDNFASLSPEFRKLAEEKFKEINL